MQTRLRRCARQRGSSYAWWRPTCAWGLLWLKPTSLLKLRKSWIVPSKSRRADKSIVQLYRGKLYARTGDFDKSIAAFNAYLDSAPQSAQADDVRALIARMEQLKAKRH